MQCYDTFLEQVFFKFNNMQERAFYPYNYSMKYEKNFNGIQMFDHYVYMKNVGKS